MSKRISELDGLRAIAILAVFIGHGLRVRMMWMGLDLFFILSGFLITGILLDTPHESFSSYIGAFYARRVRRILPPYLLLLLVVSLLFGIGWMRHWYMYIGLMNYLLFFSDGDQYKWFGPLWSLAVEEQFYLFWPLLVYFLPVRSLKRVLIAILVVEPLLRAAVAPWLLHQAFDRYHWLVYRGTFFRADTLAMGALLALVWRSHAPAIRRYGQFGLIATFAAPVVMILLNRYSHGFSTFDATPRANLVTYDVSLLAMTGLFLWGLSGWNTGLLRLKPMLWIAQISYTFYLFHEGVLLAMLNHGFKQVQATLITLVLVCVIGQLSWMFLERPILHGGNRRQRKRELAAAADVEIG